MKLEDITVQEIERWRAGMSSVRVQRELSNKTKNNLLVLMHAIFRHAVKLYGLPANPVASVDRFRVRSSGDIQVFSPEEVWALVRAADEEQDAAVFLTAAFTGLRMGELLALRWRDVDFPGSVVRVRASYYLGQVTTPKSGKVRAVPLAPAVATALAQLGRREHWTEDDDLVFAGITGSYLDGSALRRRYKAALAAAGLRPLRFHDLRHTFGTRMIAKADIRRVQEWMGHADVQTTMRYLHYAPRDEDARLVAEAFEVEGAGERTDLQAEVPRRPQDVPQCHRG
jgi:integrase